MNVLVFGATGMVGHGVLQECLAADDVTLVQTIGRTATGQPHPKLRDVVHSDMYDYQSIEAQLSGFDACFFCLGTSSVGKSEAEYTRVTEDLTMAAAATLARLNPQMTFTYVSGAGTDSTEQGRSMWARVKGRTENRLLHAGFKAAYMFRPGAIQALHDVQSKTALYRILYLFFKVLLPPLRALFPNHILTTGQIGQAMLAVARHGAPKSILESCDIRAIAEQESKTSR
ncbi:NAD(P)H-binding protein [Herminiimonas fonticola]|uniref:Putative NAD(P)-binding protein n=1 Tax=Herminiimonas fonticola TaxID=303380 RepID=A0A4R6GIG3_9BURK|nr:NAD(P)H-binding protein [Herminiimonas fonticola]RBA25691.1 NADH(P)-binding [Herminiimonas fonticola]TDN94799.1 putative NAD(P)-binding protein [Herminiimonas fonticola]